MEAPPSSLDPAVVVGIGEMGGVFARGLLRAGHPVHPVTRRADPADVASAVPDPSVALVAVAEADLHEVLSHLPPRWGPSLGLLQNELLPRDWQAHGLPHPTVAVAWFEKKPGRDVTVVVPTPVGGPRAGVLLDALAAVDIPTIAVDDVDRLLFEMVVKNCYILTANLAGLVVGGTTGQLWTEHRALAEEVATEVLDIQEHLIGHGVDREAVIAAAADAFLADPEHGCTGRSAPGRLRRALRHADDAGLAVARLRSIAASEG